MPAGHDLGGEATVDRSGGSVSLAAEGRVWAVGAPYDDGTDGVDAGHVRVCQCDGETSRVPLGVDLDGEGANDRSGRSVSLSSDGDAVALGARYHDNTHGVASGHVRVLAGDRSRWSQVGSEMDGEAAEDYCGYRVSLSSDGSIVLIGARYNDGSYGGTGHVRVMEVGPCST